MTDNDPREYRPGLDPAPLTFTELTLVLGLIAALVVAILITVLFIIG